MVTLYVKTGCPYCAMVLAKVDDLGIEIKELNVAEPGIIEELIEKGGQKMVPFLIDDSTNTSMYESADIVDYLDKNYGKERGEASNEEA